MSSTARAGRPTFLRQAFAENASNAPLYALLGLAFLLRLLFLRDSGFHNDVQAFESWSLTLTEHPLNEFYSASPFADYPPGYFFVLLLIGWFFKALAALKLISITSYPVLGVLVKLPAVFMDLVDAWLIYTIVRRFGSKAVALGAAALYALNPAAIYISASWGQVDSVSWGLVLAAINVMLSARNDETSSTSKIAWAWVLLSCSVLMKPQGVFIGLLFIAFAFTAASAVDRQRRLTGTAYGLGAGLVIAYVVSSLFHGWGDPVANFEWLFGRYTFASSVYPYNSINAFNLYTIAPDNTFWTSDAQPLSFFGFPLGPMVLWGWLLVAGAAALIIARFVQRKDDRGFLEAAMLLSFAFFVLATRMHERYVFGAFILMPPLIVFARRYLWTTVILSVTLLVNLAYSLHYQAVMEHPVDGLDGRNLWPITSHTLSFVNVAMFFVLGYLYLGGTIGRLGSDLAVASAPAFERVSYGTTQVWTRVRGWFNPAEGIMSFSRLDWALAILFSVASFVVCIIAAQWPAEQYFDEVYYPRSGQEFLEGKDINGLGVFEFTHPPLTKLIIALSMIIIGHGNGLSAMGNSPLGWRFLNIVIGAITVGVLYAFAKRLTSSTLFASLAAGMLLFDGFHYVQSRISTPEITVAFFSLCTLYAFYRLWIASQVTRRSVAERKPFRLGFGIVMAAGTVVSIGLSVLLTNWRTPTSGTEFKNYAYAVIFLYFEAAFYLAARLLLPRFMRAVGHTVTYADATQVDLDAQDKTLAVHTPDETGSLSRTYDRDGNLTYATPAATALFSTKGTMSIGSVRIDANDARLWFVLLAVFGAALAASKWNGLFDFFVVWGLAAVVCAQYWVPRFLALIGEQRWVRPGAAVLGNPFGMPLDVLVVSMLVVSGAVYAACYIPYMRLPAHHNLIDVVSMQYQMYHYHATLVATHPYASKWWQWPILQKPISYYYHDFRTGIATQSGTACCVAEILALPNPFVWWLGLLSVPFIGVLAWTERNKGYALLIVAYFLQWLPWIISPRIAFEYHFYPNLSIIVLANAILLQRVWRWRLAGDRGEWFTMPRLGVGVYALVVVFAFIYFFPVLAGSHVTYDQWHARMWMPSWII
jgi:Gpi18-like mannosyltransferase